MQKKISILLLIIAFYTTAFSQSKVYITKEDCDIITQMIPDYSSNEISLIFKPENIKDKSTAVEIKSLSIGDNYFDIKAANDKNQIVVNLPNQIPNCNTCGQIVTIEFKGCPNQSFIVGQASCPSKITCNCRNKSNFFGEEYSNYTNGKEVILLDFNKNINYRTYYRIYKKWNNNKLSIEPLTFSKYHLWGRKDVEFKIVNFNRFIYNLKFSDSLTTFESSPPPLFNEFFIGSASGVMGSLISKAPLVYGFDATDQDPAEISIENFIKYLTDFVKSYNELHALVTEAYNPCACFKECRNINYEDYANKLLLTKLSLAALQDKWVDKADTLKMEELKLEECNSKDKEYKALTDQIEAITKVDPKDKRIEALSEQKKKIVLCKEADITSMKATINRLKLELKPYTALVELKNNLPKEEDLKRLVIFVNNITDLNQTYASGPIQLNGNELNLTVEINSNDSVAKRYHLPLLVGGKKEYTIPIFGRAFGSFSSGIFMSPDPSLRRKEYTWQERPNSNGVISGGDSARYVLQESGYSSAPWGFAASGNIQCMIAKNVSIGISPGVGLTLESKPRLAYLLGGSLLMGSKKQFSISSGIAFMQVNKLSANLEPLLNNTNSVTQDNSKITYYKELKHGLFFSLQYTLFTQLKTKK